MRTPARCHERLRYKLEMRALGWRNHSLVEARAAKRAKRLVSEAVASGDSDDDDDDDSAVGASSKRMAR